MEKEKSKFEKARFDTKLTREQKELFERAAQLGGFSSLTGFVIKTAEEKAKAIILENELENASDKDLETVFDAVKLPKTPFKKLMHVVRKFNKKVSSH